ncbi:MAG: hypothetical protein GWO16_13980 [Gammaproteobacteria bacterium]|nr:hypothetical protein [Gammaproteobacteria bacterium]NIR99039.1 hypothetical protein [Gammaproteobacteria bacterium]NIT64662.1 hypothetical protein [Gammaproteobacteria bacterium]NIY33242.1 hypothetical protein [Gammaproteobacteria bacterium]
MANAVINGLGRIGRAVSKLAMDEPPLVAVAANDLSNIEDLVYLARHESVYGRHERRVTIRENMLDIDGQKIQVFHEEDPLAAFRKKDRFQAPRQRLWAKQQYSLTPRRQGRQQSIGLFVEATGDSGHPKARLGGSPAWKDQAALGDGSTVRLAAGPAHHVIGSTGPRRRPDNPRWLSVVFSQAQYCSI